MIEIRSFRRVFDLERRVYSVDRFRLNPAGVPVRGIVYVLVALMVAISVARLPLIGSLLRLAPWYVRDIAAPAAVAALLAVIRLDGRSFHLAARAGIAWGLAPSRVVSVSMRSETGSLWHPAELILLPDGSDHRLRSMRFTGPGAVLVLAAHRLAVGERCKTGLSRRRTVTLSRGAGARPRRGSVVALARSSRLVVRADVQRTGK